MVYLAVYSICFAAAMMMNIRFAFAATLGVRHARSLACVACIDTPPDPGSIGYPDGEVAPPETGGGLDRAGYYADTIPVPAPQIFNLTESQGISELCAYERNPAYTMTCPLETGGNYTVGPENPTLCFEGVNVTMASFQFGNVSVSFGKDDLESFRSVNVDNPDEYVYGLPLSKYAAPNVFYDVSHVTFYNSSGPVGNVTIPSTTFNCFNASAASLRDYYGVEDSLQGSEDTVQGSVLYVGLGDTSVNASAINEYLNLQGLVPNVPLQFSDWGPPNNVNQCFEQGANCREQMLDTQTQQAFAPQAITFFTPTVNVQGRMQNGLDPSDSVKYLIKAGYSESQAQDLVKTIDRNDTKHTTARDKALGQYVLEFFTNTTNSKVRPQVVSLSFAAPYGKFASYDNLEEALKQLALSGVTIMVASGDAGASGQEDCCCLSSSDPMMANDPGLSWPTVSPWVTVVGGTQMLATEANPEGTEVVCSSATDGGITSGGGFAGSSYPKSLYGRPAWQEKSVMGYLSGNNASTFDGFPTTKTPGYNPEGRAFPDISMYGTTFPILDADGTLVQMVGTSLSAPMAAAVFTLANQKLMEDGYGIIGYANPMLYWMGENCTEAYRDVTVGNNRAGEDGTECLFGFPAAPGWDAATGFGSINFGPFVECAKRYQDEVRSKGLEMLPDQAPSSARGSMVLSSWLVAGCIALLATLN